MHLQIRHSSQQRLLSLNFSSLSCTSGFLSPSPSLLLPTGGKVQAPGSCPRAQEVLDAKLGCTESEGLWLILAGWCSLLVWAFYLLARHRQSMLIWSSGTKWNSRRLKGSSSLFWLPSDLHYHSHPSLPGGGHCHWQSPSRPSLCWELATIPSELAKQRSLAKDSRGMALALDLQWTPRVAPGVSVSTTTPMASASLFIT